MRLRRAALAAATACLACATTASAATERVSVSSAGAEATGGESPAFSFDVSHDGRYVAFDSTAAGLAPGGTPNTADVFVRDRVAGTTERITSAPDTDGKSIYPVISADGRYVAFGSLAPLVPGDTFGWNYYVHDRDTDQVEKVGDAGGGSRPAISANGRYVAFRDQSDQVVRYDRDTDTSQLASVNGAGVPGDAQSGLPSISGDGNVVAFSSLAGNLDPGDQNGNFDVYARVFDFGGQSLTLWASPGLGGTQPDGNSFTGRDGAGRALSSDGRYVAYESSSSNLVGDDGNGQTDVFVRDLLGGVTTRASTSGGAEGDSSSQRPSISANGRVVAFDSHADNLAGASDAHPAVLVKDLQTGTITRASVGSGGDQAGGSSFPAAISGDGLTAVFGSSAGNLVADDGNGTRDLFAHTIDTGNEAPTCPDDSGSVDRGGTIAFDGACTDPDGDPLTYVLVSGPARGSLTNATPGGHVEYVAPQDFVGTVTFTFKATDGQADSNVATVTITVTDPDGNDPPSCPALIERGTQAGQAIALAPSCTDTDAGDALSYTIVDEPDHGSIVGFSYVPDDGFTGVDSFTYRANDGQTDSNVGTVRVVVADPANYEELPTGGGTVSTGSDATPADPVVTTVESPTGGVVAIFEGAESDPTPGGYTLLGQAIGIEAPDAESPEQPLRLTFRFDGSVVDPAAARMVRNGTPMLDCDDTSGTASPDPCQLPVESVGGDTVITVLTTRASVYQVAALSRPSTKDACKGSGWRAFYDGSKPRFRNQGACVSFVAAGR